MKLPPGSTRYCQTLPFLKYWNDGAPNVLVVSLNIVKLLSGWSLEDDGRFDLRCFSGRNQRENAAEYRFDIKGRYDISAWNSLLSFSLFYRHLSWLKYTYCPDFSWLFYQCSLFRQGSINQQWLCMAAQWTITVHGYCRRCFGALPQTPRFLEA